VASIFSVGPCECSLLGDSLSDSDSYSRVTCAMGLVDATAIPRRTLGPEKRRRCFLGGRGLRRVKRDGGRGPIAEERTRGPRVAERNVSLVTSLVATSGPFASKQRRQ